jgi:hypothetical protein
MNINIISIINSAIAATGMISENYFTDTPSRQSINRYNEILEMFSEEYPELFKYVSGTLGEYVATTDGTVCHSFLDLFSGYLTMKNLAEEYELNSIGVCSMTGTNSADNRSTAS